MSSGFLTADLGVKELRKFKIRLKMENASDFNKSGLFTADLGVKSP